jgi:tRNA pseudouridine38-40 synthase
VAHSEHHADYWRVKLVLHYDGRDFHGWQSQSDQRTVQGELSALLGRLCGGISRRLTAAGRTDRGVHATGQVASALIPQRWRPRQLRRALNALAPPDLWVASAEQIDVEFHPRYDAISRTYIYRIGVGPDSHSPFRAPWCWPLHRELDVELLQEATRSIAGTHDFSAFAKSGQPERGVRCRVYDAGWREANSYRGILEFEISADRYLQRMVRYLVGTLAEIGQGRRRPEEIAEMLRGGTGFRAASPAPPQGLFLARVEYSTGDHRKPTGAQGQGR